MLTRKNLKRLAGLLILGAFLSITKTAKADPSLIDGTMFFDPSLAYSTAPAFNLSRIESLSAQITASSTVVSAISFADGAKSTSTIVVVSTINTTGARIGYSGITTNGVAFNCSFTEGYEYTGSATTAGLAKAISDALAASPCLSGIFISTYSGSTVYSTATYIGADANDWDTFSSTPTALTVNDFSHGSDPDISSTTEKITLSSGHGISTGCPLLYVTVSGTAPGGLTTGTTYFAIVTGENEFELSDTSTGSLAGVTLDITGITGSGAFTLTPTKFAGTYGWYWQGSNDGENWADLSVSSVTYSVPATDMWNSGLVGNKYIRLNITTGTDGAMRIKVIGYGRGRDTP